MLCAVLVLSHLHLHLFTTDSHLPTINPAATLLTQWSPLAPPHTAFLHPSAGCAAGCPLFAVQDAGAQASKLAQPHN